MIIGAYALVMFKQTNRLKFFLFETVHTSQKKIDEIFDEN